MRTCPFCAHENPEGVFFCEDCGQALLAGTVPLTTKTKKLPQDSPESSDTKAAWGTARFAADTLIIIHIRDNPTPIQLKPQDEMILGRYDGTSTATPTLDLTPFGAYENGVSRIHAAIRRGEDTLTLVDLGSVNGTHLNGQRLIPNQPRVLRDGDEVRLGKLVCHVYFKKA
jgi:hypothetical protein